MTREEQIVEAGKTAAEGKEFSVLVNKQRRTMSAYEIGFIEGAEWADSHPAWVSVEERLPEPDPEHELRLSVDCFITDGVNIEIGYYNYMDKCWNHGSMPNITHWYIPTPPAKKGGNDEQYCNND